MEERPEKKFTIKGLSKGLSLLNKLLAQGMDGNVTRFSRVQPMAEDRFVYIVKFMRRKSNNLDKAHRFYKKKKKNPPVTPSPVPTADIDDPQPAATKIFCN